MPRYIDADKLLARYKARCAGCKETKNYCEHCCDIADVIDDIEDAPIADVVEVEKITAIIARLRSNRDSNLTRYTSNEGKESHIIVNQKDRGYFQALDDIEESLLRKEEKTDDK